MSMPWSQRFEFARRQTLDRGRGLSGFLSRLSVLGLILAVAVLLAVSSVMNGFERELEQRILRLVPHITIKGFAGTQDWQSLRDELTESLPVTQAALFHERDILIVRGNRVSPALLLGLEASEMGRWRVLVDNDFGVLKAGQVLVGQALAEKLSIDVGAKLRIITPQDDRGSGQQQQPTTMTADVVGLVRSGTELDEGFMLGTFSYVATATGATAVPNGLALQLDDLFEASAMRWQLSRTLPNRFYASDWTAEQGNLYSAIQLSRDLVTLLLLSIIAVAAFNVVSSLVLVVKDRQGAIAMLRSMGASTGDIASIYLLQGGLIGVLGASIGLLMGTGLALLAPRVAQGLEMIFDIQLLSTDVYPLSFLPVDVRAEDALLVWCVSVCLCVIAALLPARRAASLPVAEILANHTR